MDEGTVRSVCPYCGAVESDWNDGDADQKFHTGIDRHTEGYNILRAALAWFSSHSAESKLGHLPQWVTMGRELVGSD